MTERKSPALRLLEGNRSHKIVNLREPKPTIRADVPEPPDRMDDYARETWIEMAPELHKLGLLTVLDLAMFEQLCESASVVRHAHDAWVADKCALTIEGYRGSRVAHPALRVMRQHEAQMRAIGRRFGLTPADRATMKTPEPEGTEDALSTPVRYGRGGRPIRNDG